MLQSQVYWRWQSVGGFSLLNRLCLVLFLSCFAAAEPVGISLFHLFVTRQRSAIIHVAGFINQSYGICWNPSPVPTGTTKYSAATLKHHSFHIKLETEIFIFISESYFQVEMSSLSGNAQKEFGVKRSFLENEVEALEGRRERQGGALPSSTWSWGSLKMRSSKRMGNCTGQLTHWTINVRSSFSMGSPRQRHLSNTLGMFCRRWCRPKML